MPPKEPPINLRVVCEYANICKDFLTTQEATSHDITQTGHTKLSDWCFVDKVDVLYNLGKQT